MPTSGAAQGAGAGGAAASERCGAQARPTWGSQHGDTVSGDALAPRGTRGCGAALALWGTHGRGHGSGTARASTGAVPTGVDVPLPLHTAVHTCWGMAHACAWGHARGGKGGGTLGTQQGLTFGGVEAPCPPPVLGVVVDKHVVGHGQDVAVHVHRRRHHHLWDSRLRATVRVPLPTPSLGYVTVPPVRLAFPRSPEHPGTVTGCRPDPLCPGGDMRVQICACVCVGVHVPRGVCVCAGALVCTCACVPTCAHTRVPPQPQPWHCPHHQHRPVTVSPPWGTPDPKGTPRPVPYVTGPGDPGPQGTPWPIPCVTGPGHPGPQGTPQPIPCMPPPLPASHPAPPLRRGLGCSPGAAWRYANWIGR